MSEIDELDRQWMTRAIELARKAQGHVEPNPMVGAVVVKDGILVAEGYHEKFGQAHAEVNALANCPTGQADGSTLYVTLEPCCHQGKTPPCTDAILKAKPRRVVIAMADPFPKVQGGGIEILRSAGIEVAIGICEREARRLNAPYLKRVEQDLPWVIAKWAMTLDGKLATSQGSSQWISSESARQEVHRLRGRVDAIMVGSGTARLDDPTLTARPPGLRAPTRIVFDGAASLSPTSRLIETIDQAPVLLAVSQHARSERLDRLQHAGCEILVCPGDTHAVRMDFLLRNLAQRGMTNVVAEGGSQLLGLLFEMHRIDEVHAYVAGRLIGGKDAFSPIGGTGLSDMRNAISLTEMETQLFDDTMLICGKPDYQTSDT